MNKNLKKGRSDLFIWLPILHRAQRFALVIAIFVVMILCGLAYIYFILHQAAGGGKEQHDVLIPERSLLPQLKDNAVSDVQADKTDEAEEEVLVRYDNKVASAGADLSDQPQHSHLTVIRRKSAIVAPHVTPKLPADLVSTQRDKDNAEQETSYADDHNVLFYQSTKGQSVGISAATQIRNLPYKILQGKMIDAVLEPRANSDLPGMICATVQRDVYGEQGRNKLIPWGSRICGQYSTELKKGQGRLFAVWNSLRRPDGVHIALDSMGADQLGTAGMGGFVDTHFAEMFSISAMLAIIGTGATHSSHQYGRYDSYYYRDSARRAAARTARRLLEPYANIAPTVIVPAGSRIRIYVNKDLDFSLLSAQSDPAFIRIP